MPDPSAQTPDVEPSAKFLPHRSRSTTATRPVIEPAKQPVILRVAMRGQMSDVFDDLMGAPSIARRHGAHRRRHRSDFSEIPVLFIHRCETSAQSASPACS
jgi:hypothetical protein